MKGVRSAETISLWCQITGHLVKFLGSEILYNSVCPYVTMSVSLSVYILICLIICLFVYLSICIYGLLFVCLFVCLSFCLSTCLFVCVSVCQSILIKRCIDSPIIYRSYRFLYLSHFGISKFKQFFNYLITSFNLDFMKQL